METQSLYIGTEEYRGIRRKSDIGLGEIWVFVMPHGKVFVVSIDDYREPPPPPLFSTAKIVKLRKQAKYSFPAQYLTETEYPTTIIWDIIVEVADPIKYISTGQYKNDNFSLINTTVINLVHSEVENLLLQSPLGQRIYSKPNDLTLPRLEQLLKIRDFTSLVRGEPRLRNIGLTFTQMFAREVQSPAYQQIVTTKTEQQKAISDGQIALIKATIQNAINNLNNPLDLQTKMLDIVQTVVTQLGSTVEAKEVLKFARELVNQASTLPQLPGTSSSLGMNFQSLSQMSSTVTADRNTQIQQLYQEAQNQGWLIAQSQHIIKNDLSITLKNNREVQLFIPQDYPSSIVQVKNANSQGNPLPQKQVNSLVQKITAGNYSLVSLVQELDNTIP